MDSERLDVGTESGYPPLAGHRHYVVRDVWACPVGLSVIVGNEALDNQEEAFA